MAQRFEVLFYDGEATQPAYYLLGEVEGDSAEEAIALKSDKLVELARNALSLDSDFPTHRVTDALYLVRERGLLNVRGQVGRSA